jgi:lipopolysaccharide export system permease protein
MKKGLFLYIAKEMLLYFSICFLFFFLIFFVNQILLMAEDILSKKAPFRDVLMLIVYALPSIIATSAPFSALVGTLMGLGRIVTDREILAMNALGVPTRAILVPVLAVGMLISLVSFLTNDILLPVGTIQFNRLYRKILTSTPALELESNSIKRNQNSVVVTGVIANGKMDGILIIDADKDGNKRVISAPEASIRKSNNPAVLMSLQMDDSYVLSLSRQNDDDYDVIKAKDITYNILAKNILSSYSNAISPREMSSRDLYTQLAKLRQGKETKKLNMYRTEFHKKFSIPFGAFFFVILAFPIGLASKTNGQSVGFIFGLIIAVLYWAVLIGGQTLSMKIGLNGAIMMWLPNAIVLGIGLILLGKELFR